MLFDQDLRLPLAESRTLLTFTTLLANSADGKLKLFLFYPENRNWHFIQIVSISNNLHEMPKPVFVGKIEKKIQYVARWKFYQEC